MLYRQLMDPETCCYSYLLWDERSREAAIIDPVQEYTERDTALIRELGLSLKYTLETHMHADHVTGADVLRRTFNAIVVVHENSLAKNADVLVRDGDFIPLGHSRINILHTPGHTASDICYLIPGAVFTGDTLLIRSCGRTDYQSGDPGKLYDSVTQRLFTLPDETRVYPGHDYNGRTSSTIGEEKAYNARLAKGNSRDDFIQRMNRLKLDPPRRMHEVLPTNLRCGTQALYY